MTEVRLELIAAKARQLAEDHKHGRLWPNDLNKGLSELEEQIRLVRSEGRDYNQWDR